MNHTAICHKTCVCKYLGLIIYAFLLSWLRRQRTAPGALCPGTHPCPAPPAAPQAPTKFAQPFPSTRQQPETKGIREGGVLFRPPCPSAVRRILVSVQFAARWWLRGCCGQSREGVSRGGHSLRKPHAGSSSVSPCAAQHLCSLGTVAAPLPAVGSPRRGAATSMPQTKDPEAHGRGAKAPSPA